MFFTYQVKNIQKEKKKNRGGGLLSGTSRDWALGVARIPYVYWWLYQLNLAMQKKKQFRQQPSEYVFEILVWNLYFQSWTETFFWWGGRGRERVSPRQRADRTHRGRSLGVPQGKSRLRMMSRCNLFFCQSCFTLQPSIGCCWTDDDWMVGLLRTPRPLVIYIVNSKFEFQMEREIILLLIWSIQLILPYNVILEPSGSCFVMMYTSTIPPLTPDGSEMDLEVIYGRRLVGVHCAWLMTGHLQRCTGPLFSLQF